MPLADWSVPFRLTSRVYAGSTDLLFNQAMSFAVGSGVYVLNPSSCHLRNEVRATKENVPQEDGSILHRRFLTGSEMDLAVQFWQDGLDQVACDDLLQQMLDEFMGYVYGLLNAGDNDGRIAWLPDGNSSATSSYRMLDDLRLLTYPVESSVTPFELTLTVDCALPYSEDLTATTASLSGGAGTVTNNGNRPLYPVWRIYGPFTDFTLTAGSATFTYDSTLSGAVAVTNGHYLEINTFNNTVYLDGSGANRMAGIVMNSSDFFLIPVGGQAVTITYSGGGAGNNSSVAETNSAFA